jgi:hypothetical protein
MMRSLDVRTRTAADTRDVTPSAFFDEELPALVDRHAHLALPGARELGVTSFGIVTPSGAWTLALDDVHDTIRVSRGDTGDAATQLDHDEIARLVDDRLTPMTLVASARVRMLRGRLEDFLDWWVVLRSLVDGRAAHTRGAVELRDRDGAPLDVARSFTPEDDDEEIAHFLTEAGFLHLSGWFATDEMDAISRDMDGAFPHYTPDDGRSWWAETSDGTARAVRLQRFEEHSPTFAALIRDERFLRIGRLTGDGYVPPAGGEALEKPIGVVKGISDLPWHKDCSLGMHSYNCCGLTVGVSVTGADEESGALAVVPGSHRALVQPSFYRSLWGLPPRDLPTRTGDLTVHSSCTMHMSHPPVTRERRVLYTGFGLPPRGEVLGADRAAASRVRENAYKNVSQAPSPVA